MPPMALAEVQVVILYFFGDKIQLHRPICRLCCVFFSFDLQIHIIKIRISSIGTYRTMGPLESNGTIRNDYNVRATIMNKGSISVVLNSNK